MKKKIAFVIAALLPQLALAAPFFQDDFESNALALNANPVGWIVSSGTVDVVGPGFFSQLCALGQGRCIDLDGSSGQAGLLIHSFALQAGVTYTASFDLAGNQRISAVDPLIVNFGTSSLATVLGSNDAWTSYSLAFTPVQSGVYNLSFKANSFDNQGPMLDNVRIAAVPELETWAMMLLGGGVLALARARRQKTIA